VIHTGEDGIARMHLRPTAEFAFSFDASAEGYLPAERFVSTAIIQALPPSYFAASGSAKPTVVVEIFAGPRPTVELVVPNGYHGVLRAEVQTDENITYTPRQRLFRYDVPDSGVVQVVGPPVLLQGLSPVIQAHYANGTPLNREQQLTNDQVGLRWVRDEGNTQVFVVGTWLEWYDTSKAMQHEDYRDTPNGKRGGQGGQGGGRRGGGGGRGGMGGGMGGMGGH
jgi:hypothetical protein